MQPRILEKKIEEIKHQLVGISNLRPGSLSTQYNTCGKKDCRCKADPPKKHGPYYQLSLTRKGKSQTKFIKQEAVPMVEAEIFNYRRMKELMEKWIDLSIELSNARLEQEFKKLNNNSRKRTQGAQRK